MGCSRARLTPFGRRLLVDRVVQGGWPVAQAAEAVGVSRHRVSVVATLERGRRCRFLGSVVAASSKPEPGFPRDGGTDRF